jgi:hypothetical protein
MDVTRTWALAGAKNKRKKNAEETVFLNISFAEPS